MRDVRSARDVRTPAVATEAPARLDWLPWMRAHLRHGCAVPFPPLAGTPRAREGS